MKNIFKGKIILVTGGCGSIGSEIVKQLLKFKPESIRVFDHDEHAHFKFSQEVKSKRIRHLIGDIRDKERVVRAMDEVDIVFHAAALKHVPFCEYNPFEAVNTNVVGTKNLVDVAIEKGVDKFIGISTDKAVNPINTMGATKLLSEKIVTNAPLGKSKVKFCCVRFGNVLASSGSVIPIFKKQIKDGDVVTITSDKMTRFFMSLHDAVSLVLKAADLVKGGETFILKMDALSVIDLAKVLVEELAPKYGKDPATMKYKMIGVRPGEKMSESLMNEEESEYMTELKDMLVLHGSLLSAHGLDELKKGKPAKISNYNSDTVPLLNKEEIKRKLYEKKII